MNRFSVFNSEVNSRNVIEYAEHGNSNPPDHYVEFAQFVDIVMLWVGLARSGAILGPHFAERIWNHTPSCNVVFEHNINEQHVLWRQPNGASTIQAMRPFVSFKDNFPKANVAIGPGTLDQLIWQFLIFLFGVIRSNKSKTCKSLEQHMI